MKLFNIKDNKFKEINERQFKLEKDIQSITEKNMDSIFGLVILDTNFLT